jgi:hypothetical protein
MFILCDTSSILLLLRIAPDMFVDQRFECCTIREIHDELVRTAKFKLKYPWLREMRPKLKPLMLAEKEKASEKAYFDAIKTLHWNGTINLKTGRFFDLSHEDMKVISSALALDYKVSSGDKGLLQFAEQEFKNEFIGSVSALEIINFWIEKQLIIWDQERQGILGEWKAQGETAQPKIAALEFHKLTGCHYPGP